MAWQYYTGKCSDPAVQLQAKQIFVQTVRYELDKIDPQFCQREKTCNIENVRVSCGKTVELSGNRKKRNVKVSIN